MPSERRQNRSDNRNKTTSQTDHTIATIRSNRGEVFSLSIGLNHAARLVSNVSAKEAMIERGDFAPEILFPTFERTCGVERKTWRHEPQITGNCTKILARNTASQGGRFAAHLVSQINRTLSMRFGGEKHIPIQADCNKAWVLVGACHLKRIQSSAADDIPNRQISVHADNGQTHIRAERNARNSQLGRFECPNQNNYVMPVTYGNLIFPNRIRRL